jgi:hypothetical protein
MPEKEKSKVDIAAEGLADLLIEHMEATMTPAQAKAALRKLDELSQARVKSS